MRVLGNIYGEGHMKLLIFIGMQIQWRRRLSSKGQHLSATSLCLAFQRAHKLFME